MTKQEVEKFCDTLAVIVNGIGTPEERRERFIELASEVDENAQDNIAEFVSWFEDEDGDTAPDEDESNTDFIDVPSRHV